MSIAWALISISVASTPSYLGKFESVNMGRSEFYLRCRCSVAVGHRTSLVTEHITSILRLEDSSISIPNCSRLSFSRTAFSHQKSDPVLFLSNFLVFYRISPQIFLPNRFLSPKPYSVTSCCSLLDGRTSSACPPTAPPSCSKMCAGDRQRPAAVLARTPAAPSARPHHAILFFPLSPASRLCLS